MSRLDKMIDRLTAQRAFIDHVADLIAQKPGPIFELGLGNGRTYDHLRARFPEREIYVFDRAIGAHPTCIPDADYMILGDLRDTLRLCGPRISEKPVFINIDLGSGDPTADAITAEWLPSRLQPWIIPGAILLADRPLVLDGLQDLRRPDDAPPSTHRLYGANE